MSMLPTFLPARSRPTIRCIAAVDLPEPPFSLPRTMIRGRLGSAAFSPPVGAALVGAAGGGVAAVAESANGFMGSECMRSAALGAIFAGTGADAGAVQDRLHE